MKGNKKWKKGVRKVGPQLRALTAVADDLVSAPTYIRWFIAPVVAMLPLASAGAAHMFCTDRQAYI